MPNETTSYRNEWRIANGITDWEFAEIGRLLCDHTARDLALMVVRKQGQLEVERMLRVIEVKELPHAE